MPWLRSAELHCIVPAINSLLHNSRSPHNSIPALRLSPQRIHRFHLPLNLLSALQLAANFILLSPFISATHSAIPQPRKPRLTSPTTTGAKHLYRSPLTLPFRSALSNSSKKIMDKGPCTSGPAWNSTPAANPRS